MANEKPKNHFNLLENYYLGIVLGHLKILKSDFIFVISYPKIP